MSGFEELIMRAWEWIWSVSWYWIPVGLGFLFRFVLLISKIGNPEMCVKVILRDIGIIFGLTVSWSCLNAKKLDDNAIVMVFMLTFIYITYGLAESCEETGGSTESILLILKSVLLTLLSFQDVAGTIVGAFITSSMSVMAYKFWIGKEKKTDLFEIIFLCIEAIILSVIGYKCDIQGIGVFLFIFFQQTALFLLNYIVRYVALVCFGEAEKNYY